MHEIRVGTSGWRYPHWRGDYYPRGLRQRDELAYAAGRMTSLEINGSFYSMQRPSSYASWRDAAPDDFRFAVKGSRYITHMKKLVGVDTALANFFASGVLALGHKTGPVLWQLPETLHYDERRLADFFSLLPRTTTGAAALARCHDDRLGPERVVTEIGGDAERPLRHVLEFRHRSFCEPDALELLKQHDIGCVIADTAGRWPEADAVTSRDVYVRLHGDTALYASGYGEPALRSWAGRCRAWAEELDVWVYFDNDARGHAPHDAESLLSLLGQD